MLIKFLSFVGSINVIALILIGCSSKSSTTVDDYDDSIEVVEVTYSDDDNMEYNGNGDERTSHGAYSDYLEAGGEEIGKEADPDNYTRSDYYGD